MKKSFLKLLIGLIVGGLFLYEAQRKIDWAEVGHLLLRCDPLFVAALCANLVIVQLLRSERWLRTFSRIPGLRRCPVFRAFLLGNAANSLLPGRAGDLIRATVIKQEHVDIGFGLAVGTVAVEKVADLFVVMMFLLTLILVAIPLPDWVGDTATAGVAVLLSVIPLLFSIRWVQLFLARRRTGASSRIGALNTVLHGIDTLLKGFVEAFHVFAHGNGIAWVFSLSLLIWLLETITVFFGCRALGIETPVAAVVLTVVMLSFGAMLPAAPGFVGTYQWLTVASLGFFGVSETLGFAVGVLLNVSVILVNILAGMCALLAVQCGQRSEPRLI